MDEHVVLFFGSSLELKGNIEERNNKGFRDWLEKHRSYALREAQDSLCAGQKETGCHIQPSVFNSQEARKRWLKENIYLRLPLFFRAGLYFIYRYFLRLGFLDGKEGLAFHFWQGLWYRLLVDLKILELKKQKKCTS